MSRAASTRRQAGSPARAARPLEIRQVLEQDILLALNERLGITAAAAATQIDWSARLAAAVPYQARAAAEVGRVMQIAATLNGTIMGACVGLSNAKDWGEEDLSRSVAALGYGDELAVCDLDLAPFAADDGLARLLTASGDGIAMIEGSPLLARVLNSRQAGVLVLRHFDRAHGSVQTFLADAVRRGTVLDDRGRRLHLRSFTTVILLDNTEAPRALGLRTQVKAEGAEGFLSVWAGPIVALAAPSAAALGAVIVPRVLGALGMKLRVSLTLDASAYDHLLSVSTRGGVQAFEARVRSQLAFALANAATPTPRSTLVVEFCGHLGSLRVQEVLGEDAAS